MSSTSRRFPPRPGNPRGGDRMAVPGEWQVVDYDFQPLPGAWDSEQQAHEEGICGRYLLSGLDVRQVPDGEEAA